LQSHADQWLKNTTPNKYFIRDEKTGKVLIDKPETLLMKLRERKAETEKLDHLLESKIARMKHAKASRHRDEVTELFGAGDPLWEDDGPPDFRQVEEYKSNPQVHPELHKMLHSNLPEGADTSIRNEDDA